jgi:hypothetical protein
VRHLFIAAALGACCIGLDGAGPRGPAVQAQISRATATVDIVPGKPYVMAHITNLPKVTLDALQIRVDYDAGTGAQSLDLTFDGGLVLYEFPTGLPVPPGATRDEVVDVGGVPFRATVAVRMLLFADLSSEGSPTEVAAVLEQRERHAETLSTWIDVLQVVAGKPTQQGKADLEHVFAAEERRFDPSDSFALAVRDDIAALLAFADPDPAFYAARRSDRQIPLKTGW